MTSLQGLTGGPSPPGVESGLCWGHLREPGRKGRGGEHQNGWDDVLGPRNLSPLRPWTPIPFEEEPWEGEKRGLRGARGKGPLYTHEGTHAHTCRYAHPYMYTLTCTPSHTCTHTNTHHMHVYPHIYMHALTHMHAHILTYTPTHLNTQSTQDL